jgi:Transposase DDE domain/Domain of unknown function (DUF4372)
MNEGTNYIGQPIFTQATSLIDKSIIENVCKEFQSNKYSKSLSFQEHLTTMLYCVFTGCSSIREVQTGLELCNGKLNHLNLKKVPARSTLSDGNKKRKSNVFGALYHKLFEKYKHVISDSKYNSRFSEKLYILDSTTISLFKAILKPAGRKRSDGKSKGGMKAHTLLKADSNMPAFVKFTASALHDQQFYEYIKELPNDSIIAFDKAYLNYEQFQKFTERGITYVIPQKDNAIYKSIKELSYLDVETEIVKDELIEVEYTEKGSNISKIHTLRRIAYYSIKHDDVFVYITNNFEMTAMEVVGIYLNRWQIESFFKKLKQNFNLTCFLGDNVNAVEIQVWCTLIGFLLLQVIYSEHKTTIAFSILCSIVSLHLMNYTSLADIIKMHKKKRERKKKDQQNEAKTKVPPPIQQTLNF